jgi:hypothetical protein
LVQSSFLLPFAPRIIPWGKVWYSLYTTVLQNL